MPVKDRASEMYDTKYINHVTKFKQKKGQSMLMEVSTQVTQFVFSNIVNKYERKNQHKFKSTKSRIPEFKILKFKP